MRRSPVLKAAGATFERDGNVLVAPFSVEVAAGARAELACGDERAARIAARMAAGIVKPTSGTLLICDFDPRIQPVQAKRLAGYVPWNGDFGRSVLWENRRRTTLLHAALFEVPGAHAEAVVASVLARLAPSTSDDGIEFAVVFAVALALIRPVALLVCDRPPPGILERIGHVLDEGTALLSTTAGVGAPAGEVLTAR